MATFLSDLCTGTNGTNFTAHNADTGGAGWTSHPASGDSFVIESNRARSNGSEADYYHTASPAGADYEMGSDLVVLSNGNYAGLMARVDAAATTWYGAGYDNGNTRWEMFRASAGSFTTLGTASATLTVSNTYAIKLTVTGTGGTVSLTFTVGGVSTLTASDTNASRITSTGKAGMYAQSGAGSGYHHDNLLAADVGGGGAVAVKELALLGVG